MITDQSPNFETFECFGEIFQIPHVIFQTASQFFFKFYTTPQCLETNFFVLFYIFSTKGAYQSTNLVEFLVSRQKLEIFHLDDLILSKWYKVSAKNVQKSYLL